MGFPVAERFASINGEGSHAGELAAFVRFRGCNLACSYCDTAWANEPGCPVEELSADEIEAFVRETGAQRVTLTGGEPLLQPGVETLVRQLLDAGLQVEVETNGAVPIAPVLACGGDLGRLTLTLDFKLPSSGMSGRMLEQNHELLRPHDVVKFVIGDEADFPAVLDALRRGNLVQRCQVYFSPVFGRMDAACIVDFMQRERLNGCRLQLQLHKLVWPAAERGV